MISLAMHLQQRALQRLARATEVSKREVALRERVVGDGAIHERVDEVAQALGRLLVEVARGRLDLIGEHDDGALTRGGRAAAIAKRSGVGARTSGVVRARLRVEV